jgi:hypothetical protein
MKKTASVAEFTKQFGPLTNALAPGESVAVTSYGKLHGRYVREGVAQRRRRFDIGERLAREEYAAADGQRLIDSILAEA